MKKSLLLAFMVIGLLFQASAQSTVTGTVKDDGGESLPGATVTIKGTTKGTVADIDGKYSIKVPGAETVLIFNFVGFESKEVTVGSQSVIDVTLASSNVLDEVLVIGYGTTLKAESTSSIAQVTSEQIGKLNAATATQALQGLAAGVKVVQNSGAAGGGISVRVRGQSSISASNEPLYIVDGVPVVSGNLLQTDLGGQGNNALSSLNPQDIESIQVLKDAASTAIYGARGANGVVMITTKRGKSGAAKINLNVFTGFTERIDTYDKLSAADQIMIEREARYNDDPTAPLPTDAQLGWDGTTDTDWLDEIFRTGKVSEYQLSASGGSDALQYFVSGNYRNEEGAMIGNDFERYSIRVNTDYQASTRLKLGSSINFAISENNANQNDNNIYGIYSAAILTPSYRAIRDENGEFVDALPSFNTNALRAAEQIRQKFTSYRFIGNINFDYKIIDGLSFRTDFSYDWNYLREDEYLPSSTAQGRSSNGSGSYSSRDLGTWVLEPTLRFNKIIGTEHKVSAVLGSTYQQRNGYNGSITATGFARPTLTYITDAANFTGGTSFRSDYSFASVFGRASYSYNEKYLASVTIRRDGSSRFGPDNKFGTFWAVSGGWNFSEEDFFNVSFIEFGKLRASYGITGNDGIGNFQYLGAFSGGANYLGLAASTPTRLGDPSLAWEESSTIDFGLELAMFKNRLNLNIGVFRQTTDGLLSNVPVPWTTGFGGVQSNLGEIENKGIEIDFNTVNINKGGFKWTSTFNVAFLRNKVVSLVNDEPILAGFASAIIEGQPLNTFYGLKWLGVDPATGDSRFFDANNDGNITGDDFVVLGDYAPNAVGGLTNSFSYKGFSLDVFFQFEEGIDVFNNTKAFLENPSSPWGLSSEILRRWQEPGDVTDVPRVSNRSSLDFTTDNSRFLSDGSYIRLKNIVLAYNIPSKFTEKLNLRSVRVYAQATNLWTLTDYDGPDPEVSAFGNVSASGGTDFLTQPQNKTITFGFNIGL